MMVRGGATLDFSNQICQAEIIAIWKNFSTGYTAAVHSAVDAIDKSTWFLQNLTYPQLLIIFPRWGRFFPPGCTPTRANLTLDEKKPPKPPMIVQMKILENLR
jgi:hypothetical protein